MGTHYFIFIIFHMGQSKKKFKWFYVSHSVKFFCLVSVCVIYDVPNQKAPINNTISTINNISTTITDTSTATTTTATIATTTTTSANQGKGGGYTVAREKGGKM